MPCLTIKSMTTILLIRHGMTDAVGYRIAGWDPGVLLNEMGLAQVETLGRELAPVKLDAIVSSPLERAAMTAAAVAKPQGLTVTYREGLGEVRFGEWTGQTIAELERDERWRRWNTMRALERAPGGESMLDTQRRMFDELTAARDAWPGGTVALVSHADAIRSLLFHLLGMPLDLFPRLRIDPASVSIVRTAPGSLEVAAINLCAEGIAASLKRGRT